MVDKTVFDETYVGPATGDELVRVGVPGTPQGDGYLLAADFAALARTDKATALSIVSGDVEIDCALGDYFSLALTANVTSFSFVNLPGAGRGASKWVEIVQGAGPYTVDLSGFKWKGGTPGVVSVGSGDIDELAITSVDNGATWKATLANDWS